MCVRIKQFMKLQAVSILKNNLNKAILHYVRAVCV